MQVLHTSETAPINLEYLKNCVLRYMQTSEASEHSRLLPVIATILQLSTAEQSKVVENIKRRSSTTAVMPLPTALNSWFKAK
jgi:GRIP domain